MKSLPGWTIKTDEISNGVLKVTLTDSYGRKAEVIDIATDETIEKAKSDAFDVERQVSKNWNVFLYDFCLLQLGDRMITKQDYNDKAFGSWFVELQDERLVYDGKDFWLIFQTKTGSDWTDKIIIKKDELTYSNFVGLIDNLSK